ncbi:MAG: Iron-sulfur cluster repair protein YtfE [Verrucomicrobiae bacterium]|nr:Iron-sulfur cluster repair protein YtfE [Verrucomicrobiae bacterium]
MTTKTELFAVTDTVGSIVARRPALSRVFEQAGIDYCCGGKLPLAEACRKKGIDPQQLLDTLEKAGATAGDASVDPAAMSLTALADHIEATHHAYLKTELPRLTAMTTKVAAVHGGEDARLAQLRDTYAGLAMEMSQHMLKEEQVLFPMIRQLDASESAPAFHCGSLANPIRMMEMEHDQAGGALAKMRELTDGFTPPDWACNTYRAMLDALAHLEDDLHQHVHKENNILFPRAIERQG